MFSYNTALYARVHSKRLGLLRLAFTGMILIYIFCYSMGYKGGYLMKEAPIGTVRFSVQHEAYHNDGTNTPCHDPFEDNCAIKLHAPKMLSYCLGNKEIRRHQKFSCRHLDATEATTVFEKSLLIATRITEYNQERTCKWNDDEQQCTSMWKSSSPAASTFFVADIEATTLVLDHAIDTPTLGITAAARTSPQGMLIGNDDETCHTTPGEQSGTAPCFIHPNKTSRRSGLDVFRLSTLIQAATQGVTLDDETSFNNSHSLRYSGMVLVVLIEYTNFIPFQGVSDTVTYKYNVKYIKGTGAKNMEQRYIGNNIDQRTLQKRHGVMLSVKFTGALYAFDWSVCLITLTTSLALLAVATTIVDTFALYILRSNGRFTKIKYQDYEINYEDIKIAMEETTITKERIAMEEEDDEEETPLLI